MAKKRILSGNRPTGSLHLGHYFGALANWVSLQDDYDCFYFVADWHALTTEFEHTEIIKPSTQEMVMDWLAAGLDPNKSTIFVQSAIKEHAELWLLLGMLVGVGRLERIPSYKGFQEDTGRDISNSGFWAIRCCRPRTF
jgi:tryptophanyl-tRNA synthetase